MSGLYRAKVTILVLMIISPLFYLYLFGGPIGQSQKYLNFADRRIIWLMPNFFDVISSLAFSLVGVAGLSHRKKIDSNILWPLFFLGIFFIGPGSMYFHLNPNETTVIFDRLPMGVAFVSLFFAILIDTFKFSKHLKVLFIFSLILGLGSTLHWVVTRDLRFYIWVQLSPILTAILVPILFKSISLKLRYLIYAAFLYIIAKITEVYDREVFSLTDQTLSGHTLKHLLAALAIYQLVLAYKGRAENLAHRRSV